MTWEELKEKAKEMGYDINDLRLKEVEWLTSKDGKWDFLDDGTIMHDNYVVALDRTPEQMLAIMKALE